MSWLFASGGQGIGASASATVLSIGYSGLISFGIDWFDLFLEEDIALLILGHPRGNFPKEFIGQMMQ